MKNIVEDSIDKNYIINGQKIKNYVVNYPYLHFGSFTSYPPDYSGENVLIYHIKLINETSNPYDKLLTILNDANFMSYGELTNYWNVKKNTISYIGGGLDNLKKCLHDWDTNKFSISFGSDYSIFNFYTDLNSDNLVINLYVNNEDFPYVDVIDSIRNSCLNNNSVVVVDDMIKEQDIRKFWISDIDIEVQIIGYLYEKNFMEIKYPIIKNIYKNSDYAYLNNISKFITYNTRFDMILGKKPINIKYQIIIEIWETDDNFIINVDIEDYTF